LGLPFDSLPPPIPPPVWLQGDHLLVAAVQNISPISAAAAAQTRSTRQIRKSGVRFL
jgi:hypothetical protein